MDECRHFETLQSPARDFLAQKDWASLKAGGGRGKYVMSLGPVWSGERGREGDRRGGGGMWRADSSPLFSLLLGHPLRWFWRAQLMCSPHSPGDWTVELVCRQLNTHLYNAL